jgi:type VI protein secretion system component Hcp
METPYLFLDLRVKGKAVKGEATERFFEKQIEIGSVKWEMETSHRPQDGAAKSKIVTVNRPKRVTLSKFFDRSTTSLCKYMADRQVFEEAKITMVKSLAWEDEPLPRFEMTLSQGYVESVTLGAESSKSVGVKETVTLSFRSIELLYYSDVVASQVSNSAATTFELKVPSEIQ